MIKALQEIIDQAALIGESYTGQRREYVREKAVELAVKTADGIIMDASDGAVEELNYMTCQVMLQFALKIDQTLTSMMRWKELRP